MKRIRINFGRDFCGEPACDMCFADVADRTAQQYYQQPQTTQEQVNAFRARLEQQQRYQEERQRKFRAGSVSRYQQIKKELKNKAIQKFEYTEQVLAPEEELKIEYVETYEKETLPSKPLVTAELTKQLEVNFSDLLARPAKLSDETIKVTKDELFDSAEMVNKVVDVLTNRK